MAGEHALVPIAERFWSKVEKNGPNGCWLWRGANTGCPKKGIYGRIHFSQTEKGAQKMKLAHRLSWELHFGVIPEGLSVCHRCDVPLCVNPEHLFLGSAKDRARDRGEKGRTASGDRQGLRLHPEKAPKGVRNGRSVLTESQVIEIRGRYGRSGKGGMTLKQLASIYGVHFSTIANITRGETWPHVKDLRKPQ